MQLCVCSVCAREEEAEDLEEEETQTEERASHEWIGTTTTPKQSREKQQHCKHSLYRQNMLGTGRVCIHIVIPRLRSNTIKDRRNPMDPTDIHMDTHNGQIVPRKGGKAYEHWQTCSYQESQLAQRPCSWSTSVYAQVMPEVWMHQFLEIASSLFS